jgi:predicted AAA+ superfamily ATPase
MKMLRDLGVVAVNLTAGSPYTVPHISRPAAFPPSDGYPPPEDPLVGCWRQIDAARQAKAAVPGLVMVGTAYTYLQAYLVHAAQATVRQGWIDGVGLGRMVLSYPELPADSLAGRMEVLTLLPLAGCELENGPGRWLELVFTGEMPRPIVGDSSAFTGDALVERVLRGGYPEAVARPTARRREAWLRQYTAALLSRDVRDIASIEKLDQLPRLLRALAQMAGQLINLNQLAGQLLLDHKTAAKYVGVLEQLFLIRRLPPWLPNRLSRIVKTPKLHFLDSGLLAHLRGATALSLHRDRAAFGSLLESYVVSELLKLASWTNGDLQLLSYRDRDQQEVDVVIENGAGQVVGLEVKAKASVQPRDVAGLRKLAALAGDQFIAGLVLYDGAETLPLGPSLWAVPIASLWQV